MSNFKLGDIVHSKIHGRGRIYKILKAPNEEYPIAVLFKKKEFGDNVRDWYTLEGLDHPQNKRPLRNIKKSRFQWFWRLFT